MWSSGHSSHALCPDRRQVVLVDVLSALNGGREALLDLEVALGEILSCFRPGRRAGSVRC